LVEGDGNDLLHGEDFDSPSDIADASMNGMMDLFSCPSLAVLQVLQNINLAGSLWGVLKPAIPESVIGKPVLPGAGFEDFIPGFRPGKFVFESSHRSPNLFTDY
jgi:hypothetical protein